MKYVDLDKEIKNSNSTILKILPSFFVNWMKLIIKQEEINRILTKYEGYQGVDFLPKIIEELNLKVQIEGLENLPENGKCFFVANHPFGFVDGLILTHTVGTKYGTLKAIGNEFFTLAPHLRPIIAAVNVFGTNPKDYLVELENVFESDSPITHFPAGSVSRVRKGKIRDKDWHKSFIKQASKYQRDIVPFHFIGRNSMLFYSIYMVRTLLRINVNIEFMLLPYEIFHKKNKTVQVRIGKPISYNTFDDSRPHKEWAQYVKEQVYLLN